MNKKYIILIEHNDEVRISTVNKNFDESSIGNDNNWKGYYVAHTLDELVTKIHHTKNYMRNNKYT